MPLHSFKIRKIVGRIYGYNGSEAEVKVEAEIKFSRRGNREVFPFQPQLFVLTQP